MDNSNKQGIVCNKDGEIVGYNINSSIFIPLSRSDVEEALHSFAIRKFLLIKMNIPTVSDYLINPQDRWQFRDTFDTEKDKMKISFKEDNNDNRRNT